MRFEFSGIALVLLSLATGEDSFVLLSANLFHNLVTIGYINTEKYPGGREGGRCSIVSALINLHKEESYIPHKNSKFYQSQSIMPLCHGSEGIQFLVQFLDYCSSLVAR